LAIWESQVQTDSPLTTSFARPKVNPRRKQIIMSKFRIQTRQYGLALLGLTLIHGAALASDHQEAPLATSQLAADIGDYYAWHDGEDMNMVLTFGTFNAPGSPAIFSSDVLYGMHFDTSVPADGVSDRDIYARFAQNTAGEWGIQVFDDTGVLFETPVETVVESTNGKVWAGLSDDPNVGNHLNPIR